MWSMNAGVMGFSSKSKLPILLQSEAAECGIACMAMVASYHGHLLDLPTMRRKFPPSLKGATLLDLVDIADNLGFSARPLRTELNTLKEVKTPAILHWDLNHFVVLAKATGAGITIHDPARGAVFTPWSDASKHYTGILLELSPTSSFERKTEIQPVKLTDFWGRITGLKTSMLQVLLLAVFLQVFTLISPLYQQLSNAAFTAQAFDHNADLLFGTELAPAGSADILDRLLGAAF